MMREFQLINLVTKISIGLVEHGLVDMSYDLLDGVR